MIRCWETDHTLDDFYGYAGRTLETDWKFLGWKDVLCVCDPAKMYDHLYGPNGIIPDEDWELRKQIVSRTHSPRTRAIRTAARSCS